MGRDVRRGETAQSKAAAELRGVVARRIRYWARRRNLSLNRLADVAGVSRSQLYNILGASNSASMGWLTEIADALDVDVSELLRERRRRR